MNEDIIDKTIIWTEYNRKSSDESSGHQVASISRQHNELLRRFPKEEYPRAYHFQEEKSAFHAFGRDDFDKLVKLIESGKTNGLIVYHANRLGRNAISAGIIVDLIQRGKLKDIKFFNGSFENTPEGIMMLQITLSQGQYESSKLSKDVKSGNRHAFLDKKKWIGVAPIGYLNYTDEFSRETKIKIDPERFPLIQRAIRLIIDEDHTPMQALRVLNEDWGFKTRRRPRLPSVPMNKSRWYKILTDSFYYGLMKRKLDTHVFEVMGTHTPMITEEEFDHLQVILGRKGKPKQGAHDFPYKSALKCGCGSSMTAEEKWQIICPICKTKFAKSKNRVACPNCQTFIDKMVSPKVLHKIYYRCNRKFQKHLGITCAEKFTEIGQLEKDIENQLNKTTLPSDVWDKFFEYCIDYARQLNNEQQSVFSHGTSKYDVQYKELEEQLTNLNRCAYEILAGKEGLFSEVEIIEQKKQIKKQMTLVLNQKKKISQRQLGWFDLTLKLLNYVKLRQNKLSASDPDEKTKVLIGLSSNIRLMNKKLLIDEHIYLQIVQNFTEKANCILDSLEPKKRTDLSYLFGDIGPLSPVVRR